MFLLLAGMNMSESKDRRTARVCTRVNLTMDHLLQTVQQVVRYDWRPKNEEMAGGS